MADTSRSFVKNDSQAGENSPPHTLLLLKNEVENSDDVYL